MKVAIYSRKSLYTGKGESIENQIEMCKQFISFTIPNVSENNIKIFEDEGFSAKDTDRPRFQEMLSAVRQKEFGCVICYRLDRISRNVGDFAKLIEELENLGVLFLSVKEKFDTSTPMGRAMMYITSVFAQLERETLAERVRDNMLMLARTGRWLGGPPPTGFISEKMEKIEGDEKVKTSYRLKINPDEIKVAEIMFKKFLEIHSISGVGKYLIDIGVKSRNGKRYSNYGIKQILENPVYCIADKEARNYFISHNSDVCFTEGECSDKYGIMPYNKRDCSKKSNPRHEKSEWTIAVGKHKGLLTGKEWITVQNILEANKPSNPKKNMHNDYALLSGMVYCPKCNHKMFASLRKTKGKGELYDYICGNKLTSGKKVCDSKNINGKQTDNIVCNYLLQYANEGSEIYNLLEKLKKSLQKKEKLNPLADTNTRIKKCNDEIDGLVTSLSNPGVGSALIERVNTRVSELTEELEQLNTKKEYLQSDLSQISEREIQLDAISNALCSLKTCFNELSIQEKRSLVKLLVQKIEWDGENIHIFIYGE